MWSIMCEYIKAGLLSEACNLGWCLSPGRRVKFRGPGSSLLQLIHFLVRVQCLFSRFRWGALDSGSRAQSLRKSLRLVFKLEPWGKRPPERAVRAPGGLARVCRAAAHTCEVAWVHACWSVRDGWAPAPLHALASSLGSRFFPGTQSLSCILPRTPWNSWRHPLWLRAPHTPEVSHLFDIGIDIPLFTLWLGLINSQ